MENIKSLIKQLSDKDVSKRQRAKVSLEQRGKEATPFLVEALKSKDKNTRRKAVKALITIKDPEATWDLIDLLIDEAFDIRWLAAEALIQLGEPCLVPLLKMLSRHPNSDQIRDATHHVLRVLKERIGLKKELEDVMKTVWDIDPSINQQKVIEVAVDALESK